MRKTLFLMVILGLAAMLWAHDKPNTRVYGLKGPLAEWKAPAGKTFDDVWTAVIYGVMRQGMIRFADKNSGFIYAECDDRIVRAGALMPQQTERLNVYVRSTADGVVIWIMDALGRKGTDCYENFFADVVDFLK
jgi:hypothetical protein